MLLIYKICYCSSYCSFKGQMMHNQCSAIPGGDGWSCCSVTKKPRLNIVWNELSKGQSKLNYIIRFKFKYVEWTLLYCLIDWLKQLTKILFLLALCSKLQPPECHLFLRKTTLSWFSHTKSWQTKKIVMTLKSVYIFTCLWKKRNLTLFISVVFLNTPLIHFCPSLKGLLCSWCIVLPLQDLLNEAQLQYVAGWCITQHHSSGTWWK